MASVAQRRLESEYQPAALVASPLATERAWAHPLAAPPGSRPDQSAVCRAPSRGPQHSAGESAAAQASRFETDSSALSLAEPHRRWSWGALQPPDPHQEQPGPSRQRTGPYGRPAGPALHDPRHLALRVPDSSLGAARRARQGSAGCPGAGSARSWKRT